MPYRNSQYIPVSVSTGSRTWQETIIDKDLSTPPALPTVGDRYIIPIGSTGAWAGMDRNIAQWNGTEWEFSTPEEGWECWAADENEDYIYDGSNWEPQLNPSVEITYDVDGRVATVVRNVAGVEKSNVIHYTGDKVTSITENIQGIIRTKTMIYDGDTLVGTSKWV